MVEVFEVGNGEPWGRGSKSAYPYQISLGALGTTESYLDLLAGYSHRLLPDRFAPAATNLFNGTIASIRQDLSLLREVAGGGTTSTIEIPAANEHRIIRFNGYVDLTPSTASFERFRWFDAEDSVFASWLTGVWWPIRHPGPDLLAINWRLRQYGAEPADLLIESIERLTPHVLTERRKATIRITVSKNYAAFLIKARQRLLILASFVKSYAVRLRAHVTHIGKSLAAIIAVFMSHRHRHEPADGWLLPKTSMFVLGGMQ
jgi:hypothetical protein